MAVDTVVVKFSTSLPHLDERQRRLHLASENQVAGHRGIAAVAVRPT